MKFIGGPLRNCVAALILINITGFANIAFAGKMPSKAEGLSALDEKNGFRDVMFGINISSTHFKGSRLVEDSGNTKFYVRPTDKMQIGGSELESITYSFYKDHLSGVMIKAKGKVNSASLLEVFKAAYGPGHKGNQFIERYFWFGAKVMLYFDENVITGDATAALMSEELRKQKEIDEKAEAEAAKDDI